MELKQIKELMAAMERAGIKKLSIKEESGYAVEIERECAHPPVTPTAVHESYVYAHPPHREHHLPFTPPTLNALDNQAKQTAEGKFVTSPMVGTFYAAASPDDPSFVKVGDRVEEGTIVCIVEAMKVMNEVKASMSGTIAEICVSNAHPVEFGTKLFRIV